MFGLKHIGKIVENAPPGQTMCANTKFSTLPRGRGVCSRNGGILILPQPGKRKEPEVIPDTVPAFVSPEPTAQSSVSPYDHIKLDLLQVPVVQLPKPKRGGKYNQSEMDHLYWEMHAWLFTNPHIHAQPGIARVKKWLDDHEKRFFSQVPSEKIARECFYGKWGTSGPDYWHPKKAWEHVIHAELLGAMKSPQYHEGFPDIRDKDNRTKELLKPAINKLIYKAYDKMMRTAAMYWKPFYFNPKEDPQVKINLFNSETREHVWKEFMERVLIKVHKLEWLDNWIFDSSHSVFKNQNPEKITLEKVLAGTVPLKKAKLVYDVYQIEEKEKDLKRVKDREKGISKIAKWVHNYLLNGRSKHWPTFVRYFQEAFPDLTIQRGINKSEIVIDTRYGKDDFFGGIRLIIPVISNDWEKDRDLTEIDFIYMYLQAQAECLPTAQNSHDCDRYKIPKIIKELRENKRFSDVGINYAVHMRL